MWPARAEALGECGHGGQTWLASCGAEPLGPLAGRGAGGPPRNEGTRARRVAPARGGLGWGRGQWGRRHRAGGLHPRASQLLGPSARQGFLEKTTLFLHVFEGEEEEEGEEPRENPREAGVTEGAVFSHRGEKRSRRPWGREGRVSLGRAGCAPPWSPSWPSCEWGTGPGLGGLQSGHGGFPRAAGAGSRGESGRKGRSFGDQVPCRTRAARGSERAGPGRGHTAGQNRVGEA